MRHSLDVMAGGHPVALYYWPMMAITVIAAVFAFISLPASSMADAPPPAGRSNNAIDGLRGFLALGVFILHAAIYQTYLRTGVWELPQSAFITMCGQGGVALFFMITAYLFWGRVLHDTPRWTDFYIGRVFRIGPLYLSAFAVVLFVTLLRGPGEPLIALAKHLVRWLLLGAGGAPQLNGYPNTHLLLAGVTWSLQYEWGFYLALPLLARFRGQPVVFSALALCGLLVALLLHPSKGPSIWGCGAFFTAGALCASLPRTALPRGVGSCVVIALVAVYLAAFDTAYAPLPVLIACAAFWLIASGETVFGLLRSRAAVRLGNVSYGIYLLQGLLLAGAFALQPVRSFALSGEIQYLCVVVAIGVALVAVSVAAYWLVERPGIRLGRQLLEMGRCRLRQRAEVATSS